MKRVLISVLFGFFIFAFANQAGAACVFQTISIGQTVTGSLTNTDCLDVDTDGRQYYGDYYKFNGTAGQQIYISQTSTAIDSFLFLIYPDGSYIADNNGGGGTNARLPSSGFLTLPQTGVYIVEASSNVQLQTGAYTLAVLTNSAPPPSGGDPVLRQDVTGIVDQILGLIGGDSATGILDQLQLILNQVINAGSNTTCPAVTITPPLENLDKVPPNLQISISYGNGCTASDGKTMSGSASISFTNLALTENSISASGFSMTFNNVKVNGKTYANGSASGSLSLVISSSSSSSTLNIESGQASLQLTNFLLSNGDTVNGNFSLNATSANSMQVTTSLSTPSGTINLSLALAKQADGSYVVNTTTPGQGQKGFTIEIKSLVLNSTTCTSGPIGGSIKFTKGAQIATVTFDASCSGTYAYSDNGVPSAANYSDSWWNANESGWGLTIIDHGSNLFVQWYTYDQSGHNQKYVISGGTFSNGKCAFTGTIQHVTGPSWTAATFDPTKVVRNNVGSGTIDFCPSGVAAGTIVFNYTADGVTGSKQLTRLSYGNDVPHWGGSANTGGPDFTDLWWNPAESGWGVSITQHGNNVFFRIFVYDTDSRPLLFVVPGVTFTSPSSFGGSLQLTTGPWFGSNPFDPSKVVRTTAGNATLTFGDANNGVLTYTVNGVTKTKSITRLTF